MAAEVKAGRMAKRTARKCIIADVLECDEREEWFLELKCEDNSGSRNR